MGLGGGYWWHNSLNSSPFEKRKNSNFSQEEELLWILYLCRDPIGWHECPKKMRPKWPHLVRIHMRWRCDDGRWVSVPRNKWPCPRPLWICQCQPRPAAGRLETSNTKRFHSNDLLRSWTCSRHLSDPIPIYKSDSFKKKNVIRFDSFTGTDRNWKISNLKMGTRRRYWTGFNWNQLVWQFWQTVVFDYIASFSLLLLQDKNKVKLHYVLL